MTKLWARMDEAGCIPQELRSYATEGWVPMPSGLSVEAASGLMRIKGDWLARPRVAAPTVTAVKGGWQVVIDGLPDGARCDVYDRDFHELLDDIPAERGTIAFLIADPGQYQIDITAPAPWIGRTVNVVLP